MSRGLQTLAFASTSMSGLLTLLAGPHAFRMIRDRGLRAEDVDIMPGASGGAKWLVACLGQRDPVAALGRGHQAYIYEQR
jgi:hypothetical protein